MAYDTKHRELRAMEHQINGKPKIKGYIGLNTFVKHCIWLAFGIEMSQKVTL